MNRFLPMGLVLCAALAATPSNAQLVNPGFESGDFSGWQVFGEADHGIDLDGTPLSGGYYSDNVVNVRSGDRAAWAQVRRSPFAGLVLTQTVPVQELRVYDIGFWQSVGRTDGTDGIGMHYIVSVDGAPIQEKDGWSLPAGNDSSSFLHERVRYATSAGQTTATVTFSLSGSGTGLVGVSYDDFHFDLTPACGDGVHLPTEACDDGNPVDGDCCSSSCEITNEGLPCDDGQWCTVGDTCSGGFCATTLRDCADTDLCTYDYCYEYTQQCHHGEGPAPASACLDAPNAKFQIADSVDAEDDKLTWKWSSGDAFDQSSVGAPVSATSYALCVYDSSRVWPYPPFSFATVDLEIPASSPGWRDKDPRGAMYVDKTAALGGITRLRLKTGQVGRTKMSVSAAGPNLTLPPAAGDESYFEMYDGEFVVQLRNSQGQCWSSTFTYEDLTGNSVDGVSAQLR